MDNAGLDEIIARAELLATAFSSYGLAEQEAKEIRDRLKGITNDLSTAQASSDSARPKRALLRLSELEIAAGRIDNAMDSLTSALSIGPADNLNARALLNKSMIELIKGDSPYTSIRKALDMISLGQSLFDRAIAQFAYTLAFCPKKQEDLDRIKGYLRTAQQHKDEFFEGKLGLYCRLANSERLMPPMTVNEFLHDMERLMNPTTDLKLTKVKLLDDYAASFIKNLHRPSLYVIDWSCLKAVLGEGADRIIGSLYNKEINMETRQDIKYQAMHTMLHALNSPIIPSSIEEADNSEYRAFRDSRIDHEDVADLNKLRSRFCMFIGRDTQEIYIFHDHGLIRMNRGYSIDELKSNGPEDYANFRDRIMNYIKLAKNPNTAAATIYHFLTEKKIPNK